MKGTMLTRRGLMIGATSAAAASAPACSPSVVRRVENTPIVPDPRGGTLVVINGYRARYGPVFFGTSNELLGACVTVTHFVTVLSPGPAFLVAYDDASYDAAEADIAPNAIYALEIEHTDSELQIRPLVPMRDPIRRLLDETDRVVLARGPNRRDLEEFARKVRLARIRYSDYAANKRAARALNASHAWRN